MSKHQLHSSSTSDRSSDPRWVAKRELRSTIESEKQIKLVRNSIGTSSRMLRVPRALARRHAAPDTVANRLT